ncbi:MAG: iodotyrosine deiodinase, partial [Porticoccaceae bacterium]
MVKPDSFIPLVFSVQEERLMEASAALFYEQMSKRRSVRDFSDRPIPRSVLEHAVLAAGSA